MKIIVSGSAAINSCQLMRGECCPVTPPIGLPPAISTSSGIQFPANMSGSVHSIQATRGGLARRFWHWVWQVLTLAWRADTIGFQSTLRVSPTRWISAQTSAIVSGWSEIICGWELVNFATAISTSGKLTAQTSHWSWVIMWVGCNCVRTSRLMS